MAEQPGLIRSGIDQADFDDLKNIRGIGPGIETRLHESGIHTYAQLARMTPEELAARVGDFIGMSAARVERQDWIGQAKKLAKEARKMESITANADSRQHYAVFTIELLLGSDNSVRRTRLLHVQGQTEESWAGWDEARLAGFLREKAKIKVENGGPSQPGVEPEPAQLKESGTVSPLDIKSELFRKGSSEAHLVDHGFYGADDERVHRSTPSDRPFQVRMTLDLSQADLSPTQIWLYRIVVYAKNVNAPSHLRVVGRGEGILPIQERVDLNVKGLTLDPGFYRLETYVEIVPQDSDRRRPTLMAMTEGEVIQAW